MVPLQKFIVHKHEVWFLDYQFRLTDLHIYSHASATLF